MAIALSEFWSRLVRSGLADTNDCKQYAARYAQAHHGAPPSDAVLLVEYLLKTKEITPYQAQTLLADQPVTLRLGRYLIRAPQGPPPLTQWLNVVRDQLVDEKKILGFLRYTDLPPDASSRSVDFHADVQARSLQPIEIDSVGQRPIIFSPLPTGICLFNHLRQPQQAAASGQQFSEKQTLGIAISLIDALQAMHRASWWHAAVRTDRVWLKSRSEAILLRDCGCLDNLESALLYAAPELKDPSTGCSAAADIYSLGCLIYRLATGRFPYESNSTSELRSLHATTIPADISRAIEQGTAGNPLLRVVAYAIAKNPSSRFKNVDQFGKALRAAQSMLDPKTVPPITASAIAVSRTRKRKKVRRRAPLFLGSLGLIVLLLVIALLVRDPAPPQVIRQARPLRPLPSATLPEWKPPTTEPPEAQANQAVGIESDNHSPASAADYQVVGDDRLLWAPPYAVGIPTPLAMLPPGPGMILVVNLPARTPEQTESPESPAAQSKSGVRTMLGAFSPELDDLIESAAQRGKVPTDSIRSLAIAMHRSPNRDDGWPQCSLVITLRTPKPLDQLVELWEVTAAKTAQGATIYAGDEIDSDAFFIKPSDQQTGNTITQFSVGSIDSMSEVAELEGSEIVLPPNLKSLWDATSRESDLAVLVTPNFLFSDARAILQTAAPRFESPLKSLLIPDVAAAMFTATFSDDKVYAELRFAPSGGISISALMNRMRQAVDATPTWAENFILDSVPDASWRLLANRLPSMLRFVKAHARFGLVDQSAVGNLYLPENAAAQISLATVLAMNTLPSELQSLAPEPVVVLSVDEILNQKISVSFDQESLQFGVEIIVEQLTASLPEGTVVPEVQIMGGDLQKMGITQNQQVRGFNKSDLAFRTILTDLLLGANPDKTARGADDPKQALIWVVTDDPQNSGEKVILITTRQAAEGRYELPSEF